MALFYECMLKCARKLLDTADIVRDAPACFFLRVIGFPPYTIEVGFPRFPVQTIS